MVCKGFLFLLFSYLLFNVYPYQNPQKKYKVSSIPLFVCVCVWVCESMCVYIHTFIPMLMFPTSLEYISKNINIWSGRNGEGVNMGEL